MRSAVIGAALLLGACGGQPVTSPAVNNSVDSPAPPVSVECSGKPDFAPVEADAKITTCTQADIAATGKVSGTIVYTSDSEVGAVLARAKDHALKAGLNVTQEDEMTVAASEGQRTLRVMAMPKGAGSNVTVNWGRAK